MSSDQLRKIIFVTSSAGKSSLAYFISTFFSDYYKHQFSLPKILEDPIWPFYKRELDTVTTLPDDTIWNKYERLYSQLTKYTKYSDRQIALCLNAYLLQPASDDRRLKLSHHLTYRYAELVGANDDLFKLTNLTEWFHPHRDPINFNPAGLGVLEIPFQIYYPFKNAPGVSTPGETPASDHQIEENAVATDDHSVETQTKVESDLRDSRIWPYHLYDNLPDLLHGEMKSDRSDELFPMLSMTVERCGIKVLRRDGQSPTNESFGYWIDGDLLIAKVENGFVSSCIELADDGRKDNGLPGRTAACDPLDGISVYPGRLAQDGTGTGNKINSFLADDFY